MVRKPTQTKIEGPLVGLGEILPNPLKRLAPELEVLTGINRLNREYQQFPVDLTPTNFWETCLSVLKVEPRISEEDLQRIPAKGPLVIVANCPFGGLEAVVLGTLLKQVRPDFRMMGNYLLKKIPEIQPWIFPVDPFGNLSSSPANSTTLREAVRFVRAGGALVIFPAGEVSYSTLEVTAHHGFSVDTSCFSNSPNDKSDGPADVFSRSEQYPLPVAWSYSSKIADRVIDPRTFQQARVLY